MLRILEQRLITDTDMISAGSWPTGFSYQFHASFGVTPTSKCKNSLKKTNQSETPTPPPLPPKSAGVHASS